MTLISVPLPVDAPPPYRSPHLSILGPLCYKTKYCRHMLENGSCPFGAYCSFAHTRAELRTIQQNESEGLLSMDNVRNLQNNQIIPPPEYHVASPPLSYESSSDTYSESYYDYFPPYPFCKCPQCTSLYMRDAEVQTA